MPNETSVQNLTGLPLITGIRKIPTSMSWSGAAPTMARTLSSAVITSAAGFAGGPPNASLLELGPRSEREIRSALEKEVAAERWTNLDRALRNVADEGAGIANLRPGDPDNDPELRRLLVGRAKKLERLGLAEQINPGCWSLISRS